MKHILIVLVDESKNVTQLSNKTILMLAYRHHRAKIKPLEEERPCWSVSLSR